MASQVDIANLAFVALGANRITSFDDGSKNANTVKAIYDQTRDAELRRHLWNFAMTRDSLAALSDEPEFGFDLMYQLPSDCLRLVQVGEYFHVVANLSDALDRSEQPYQLEGRRILTDLAAPLSIRYIAQVTDTTQYDALFVQALGKRLALEMCEALTQSTTKKETIQQDYADIINEAKRTDAIENPPENLPDDSWLLSRL